MDSTFFFKIWRPCQKDLGQNSKWDTSLLTDVAIVLSGGAIGLTENPQMIERWMVTGPELSRVAKEFEGVRNELDELSHHQ